MRPPPLRATACSAQKTPSSQVVIDHSQTHPPLVTVAMTDKQCRSHTLKNMLQSKEETDNTPKEKTEQVTSDMEQDLRTLKFLNCVIFKEIKTINNVTICGSCDRSLYCLSSNTNVYST